MGGRVLLVEGAGYRIAQALTGDERRDWRQVDDLVQQVPPGDACWVVLQDAEVRNAHLDPLNPWGIDR